MMNSIKAIFGARVNIEELHTTAMKEGMKTRRLSGAMKVAEGEATIAEVLRVARYSGTV